MIELLNSIDNDIFLTLNGYHCAYFDHFMKIATGKLIWVPFYASILYVMTRNLRLRQLACAIAAVALTILIADQLCSSTIRPVVARLRPANLENSISPLVHIVDGYRGGAYGFPSCHAANTFALAGFIGVLMRRGWLTAVVIVWAVLNSYSRLYLGVHYPGDLIVGGIIGAAVGMLMAFVARKAIAAVDRRYQMHSPAVFSQTRYISLTFALMLLIIAVAATATLFSA